MKSPSAKTGCEQFSELCQKLIEEDGRNYLYPEIARTRPTDWMAHIFDDYDSAQRVKLATGQADTMDAACLECVNDYHVRQQVEVRKAELLKNPEVVEALELFKK